jgi:hypothetical protein
MLTLTMPLNASTSLRLFDNYERGRIDDWHYAGFNQTLVYGNTVYADGGPQSYSTNVVGLFVDMRL